jgi:hypothetical protein
MPIRDLLWACPICGAVGGLRADGKVERCGRCTTMFRRGARSTIEAVAPDGTMDRRPATEWAAHLPADPLPIEPDGPTGPTVPNGAEAGRAGERVRRRDRALARFALGDEPIRRGRAFLGYMERLGPPRPGLLTLTDDRLLLRLDDGQEHHWALERLAALQASSATIQVRPRGEAIVSFSFPETSVRLWEESIAAALRRKWRSLGRGEIAEFQPRIVAR